KNPIILVDFALGTMNQNNQKALSQEQKIEIADAIDQLRQVEPGSFRTVVTRARFLAVDDQPREAVKILNAYLANLHELAPEELVRDLVKQQKPAEAMEALRGVFQKGEEADFRRLSEHVQTLLSQGNETEALAVLQRFLAGADYVDAVYAEMHRTAAHF